MDVIELLSTSDKRSDILLDYVTVFFNVVIAKMKIRGAEIENMKNLWHQLTNDDIMKVFRVTLKSLGFVESDIDSIKLILDLVYERDDTEFKVDTETVANDATTPPNSPIKSMDPEVQRMLLFLQVQDDLDTPLKRVLRRAVTTAHTAMMTKQQYDRTAIRFLNFQPENEELCSIDDSSDSEVANLTEEESIMVTELQNNCQDTSIGHKINNGNKADDELTGADNNTERMEIRNRKLGNSDIPVGDYDIKQVRSAILSDVYVAG